MRNKLVPSSMKAHARVMIKTSIVIYEPMNELPVIGSVLYSQMGSGIARGAKIASRCEKMYGGNLLDVPKKRL